MKSYTLTQISGTDFTVSLNGTPLTVAEFENIFYSAGEAQLISDADASGFTIWDSDQKDGNSISSTAEIVSATPYNATWDDIESGATSNVFTSVEEADGIGLTKFQLSELMGKIKGSLAVKVIDETVDIRTLDVGIYRFTDGHYPDNFTKPTGYSQTRTKDSFLWVTPTTNYSSTYKSVGFLYLQSFYGSVFYCGSGTYNANRPTEAVQNVKYIQLSDAATSIPDSVTWQGNVSQHMLATLEALVPKFNTKLDVNKLLAGSGVTLTTSGSGANQTVTIDADSAPAFTTNEWNALWS